MIKFKFTPGDGNAYSLKQVFGRNLLLMLKQFLDVHKGIKMGVETWVGSVLCSILKDEHEGDYSSYYVQGLQVCKTIHLIVLVN